MTKLGFSQGATDGFQGFRDRIKVLHNKTWPWERGCIFRGKRKGIEEGMDGPVMPAPLLHLAGTTSVCGSMAERYPKYHPWVGPCPSSKTVARFSPVDPILHF